MGGISKQGNQLLQFLLVETANIAVRFDHELREEYLHRCHQKHFTVAKVATARKLAIRMYWMLRTQTPFHRFFQRGSPEMYSGQRKPDRQAEEAPSHPIKDWVSEYAIMVAFVTELMVGGEPSTQNDSTEGSARTLVSKL
jgi:hypothetical protein